MYLGFPFVKRGIEGDFIFVLTFFDSAPINPVSLNICLILFTLRQPLPAELNY